MKIEYSIQIDRPPKSVFPWLASPEKAKLWQKNVKEGRILENLIGRVGTKFVEVIEEDGQSLEMKGEITAYVEGKAIGFHLDSRIHSLDVNYQVTEAGTGSRVSVEGTVHWKFPMNIASLFIGSRMQAGILEQTDVEFRELKRLCEA